MSYFPGESESFKQLIGQLSNESVLVLGHRRPDGDCVGSQIALTRFLLSLGIDARAVNHDPVPRTLSKFVADTPFGRPGEIDDSNNLVMTVDCADHERVGEDLVKTFPKVLLNIDHHISNTKFARHNLILPEASATAEILAKFFFDAGYEMDKRTAEALYLGICTDTGQFCHSGTNASVFEVCRKLCDAGASPSKVAHELYEREKPGRIQLLQKFLSTFQMEFDGKVCIGSVYEEFYLETGTQPEDCENFVDYARSLEGVQIGVLLENRKGALKGSFRAKDEKFRVDLLAKHFGGGGHSCAAGFNFEGKMSDFYPQLINALGKHLEIVKVK